MKAMVLTTPARVHERPLVLRDVPDPTPGAGEVLVRVSSCGVCRTDLHEVEGELAMRRRPVIPGHQAVGRVAEVGEGAVQFSVGDRVGVPWLHHTCGSCEFCGRGTENLCASAAFTGWSVDGGYAEYLAVPESYALAVPSGVDDAETAPLLCAGLIGYRALRACGELGPGRRLAMYGFGASAHLTIQVAKHFGCHVFVVTRSERNRELATALGADWTGGREDTMPARPHASIIFAPAGPMVRDALGAIERGGVVVTAGIFMSPVPGLDYVKHLYDEKTLRSVAHATRRDGREFLEIAGKIGVRTTTQTFALEDANEALIALADGAVRGAAVLRVS